MGRAPAIVAHEAGASVVYTADRSGRLAWAVLAVFELPSSYYTIFAALADCVAFTYLWTCTLEERLYLTANNVGATHITIPFPLIGTLPKGSRVTHLPTSSIASVVVHEVIMRCSVRFCVYILASKPSPDSTPAHETGQSKGAASVDVIAAFAEANPRRAEAVGVVKKARELGMPPPLHSQEQAQLQEQQQQQQQKRQDVRQRSGR